MFEYFYNEILRRTIISFGTLFNSISIKQSGGDTDASIIRVPLAYGPTQKFLARLTQSPDLNKATSLSLPRMSFEFTGLTYDPSRKVTSTQKIVVQNPDATTPDEKKVYMPVPYNMQFELAVMCKLNDDALQITEQILPYFQPSYNLTVNLVGAINEKRDIPVVLENITMQDDYEGDFESRRVLLYTLRFTAKTYLFGPVTDASKDNLASDITKTQTTFEVDDGSTITASSGSTSVYIDVGGEELYVKAVDGNKLTVKRGQDGTTKLAHIRGTSVKSITSADNALVEEGDDFGFSGTTTWNG